MTDIPQELSTGEQYEKSIAIQNIKKFPKKDWLGNKKPLLYENKAELKKIYSKIHISPKYKKYKADKVFSLFEKSMQNGDLRKSLPNYNTSSKEEKRKAIIELHASICKNMGFKSIPRLEFEKPSSGYDMEIYKTTWTIQINPDNLDLPREVILPLLIHEISHLDTLSVVHTAKHVIIPDKDIAQDYEYAHTNLSNGYLPFLPDPERRPNMRERGYYDQPAEEEAYFVQKETGDRIEHILRDQIKDGI